MRTHLGRMALFIVYLQCWSILSAKEYGGFNSASALGIHQNRLRSGFSTETRLPTLFKSWIKTNIASYTLFACWTRVSFICDKFGRPKGNSSDLRGTGPPGVTISLALEHVPQGGAICDATTEPLAISDLKMDNCDGSVKSSFVTGTLGLCLLPW